MAKNKISEFDVNPDNNTDINNINIAEGCAPSGINNAIRQLMADLKEFQTGAGGDSITATGVFSDTVGEKTSGAGVTVDGVLLKDGAVSGVGAFTTLSASGAFSANGGATLGDASGDALTINSSAVSIPNGLNFGSNNLVLSSGNVGIGTSSPSGKLSVAGSVGTISMTTDGAALTFSRGAANYISATTASGFLVFETSGSNERMRIDSGGGVAIGKTQASEVAQTGSGFGFAAANSDPFFSVVNANASGGNACIYLNRRTTGVLIQLGTNNGSGFTVVGTISHNGSNTAYNTSSDYRLKDNIAPMTGALAKVSALKPCTYTWKSTGADGQGFIAHELAEVFPDAVTGEKDALDKDGNIAPQGIDTSYLVATLTAAIQEQQAIITDLKARIETLESK